MPREMRFFILSIIISLLPVITNGRPYYFRHYRNNNGLSNNTVESCIQDKRGFIWFCTKEGLNRFDGYQFKIFYHNPDVPNSIIDNFVSALCEDRDGWIWVGTTSGLCYYNPDNDYFSTIQSDNQTIEGMVLDIKADDNDCIWVTTYSGTYKYNKVTKKLYTYSAAQYFRPIKMCLTNAGDIWLSATDGKIYKYNQRTDDFTGYQILTGKDKSASVRLVNILDAGNYGLIVSTDIAGLRQFEPNSGRVTDMFNKDDLLHKIFIRTTCLISDEEIWIGSESGIHIYNLNKGYVTSLQMVMTDPFSLSNNMVRFIKKDREGGIWVGTYYGGVNYLPQENKPFEKYYPTGLPGALSGNVIREIHADKYGKFWIGTEDAGLIKFDPGTEIFSPYNEENKNNRINSRNVQGLLVDNNDLWVGTFDNGIYVLDISTDKIKAHYGLNDGHGLNTNSFVTFLKTTDGTIYAGSAAGLYRYDPDTRLFKYLDDVAGGFFIHALFEDHKGTIWIGTYGRGLFRYDKSSNICEKILSGNGNYEKLKREFITSIFEDDNHRLWFTTEGSGFSYIDEKTGEIIRYVPGKDIDFSICCAMLQDGFGNLWITTTRGLLRLDIASNKITTYTVDNGLPDNTFNFNSAYEDESGRMYFGTVSGLLSFRPFDIKENTYNPSVYFTGIQVNGKEFLVNSTGSADFNSALITRQIRLKHNQSTLSIDFVSPTFTSPNLTKYKYRMEGSDPDWVLISGNRKVYYTNLSPGEYRFRVLASSDGNTWSQEEARLDIKISPPIWLSIPAYTLYIFILAIIGYLLISFYLKKKALEQQRKIDIIETSKEKEILNAKISFFTNITHEVRTPLTLIKGPIDRILKTGTKNTQENDDNLAIIKRNTDRLLNLTNQLLDFRKTEKEILKLNFIKTDLCDLIKSTFNLFFPFNEERMISAQLNLPADKYELAVDREAITKILSNLLSNAFKFAESRVDLYLETGTELDNKISIRVNSDGKLIPKDLSEKIFEPFYQIDSENPVNKGTGLGLSLARSIAELHNGRLFLDTNVRHGNSFVLELIKYQEESISAIVKEPEEVNQGENNEFEIFGSPENISPNILLVEDETEMGRFIAREIAGEYTVILASNGKEALKALKMYNIIAVVSDVIMPVMNGYELCRQIKYNIEFSHIPVILLTASVHLNAKIEGLDSGADAYIEKPFTTELLMAQIPNLIKNRSLDRQNFISSPFAQIKSVAMNKTDEEFLKRLNSILMENISEHDLSVEWIAEKMSISVSTLYRKVKALTDLNSVEYIMLARLKKAAELLSDGNYRVNEISYLVGFSSPSYFSTSFLKQFGMTPSQFVKRLK